MKTINMAITGESLATHISGSTDNFQEEADEKPIVFF